MSIYDSRGSQYPPRHAVEDVARGDDDCVGYDWRMYASTQPG